jgi:glycerol-3-phosphate dehydrogenase
VDSYPYIEAEVRYAVREYARTVEDVVCLRTRLAYLNVAAAREAIPRVAEIMAEELGWTEEATLDQIAQAKAAVAEFGGPEPRQHGVEAQGDSFSVDTGDLQGSGTAFG